MTAYRLMKRIIERGLEAGTLDRNAIMEKLDTFYAGNRITTAQYEELVAMLGVNNV